jgi:hypothetical protein
MFEDYDAPNYGYDGPSGGLTPPDYGYAAPTAPAAGGGSATIGLPFVAHEGLVNLVLKGNWRLARDGRTLEWSGQGAPSAGPSPTQLKILEDFSRPAVSGNWREFVRLLVNHQAANQDVLTSAETKAFFDAVGINITPANQSGQISKIQLPSGEWVRVLEGDPIAGGSWTWVPQGTSEGGGGAPGPLPDLGRADPAQNPVNLKAIGDFAYPDWVPPEVAFPTYDYPKWAAPTKDEFVADPGYEFARTEGLRGITNKASAQGLLRSPNALKSAMTFASSLADQAYGNYYNRRWNEHVGEREGTYMDYMADYNKAADTWNRSLTEYGTNFEKAAKAAGSTLDYSNANWRNLLSLYDLTRPRLSPPTPPTY